jgi:hypothetical protein
MTGEPQVFRQNAACDGYTSPMLQQDEQCNTVLLSATPRIVTKIDEWEFDRRLDTFRGIQNLDRTSIWQRKRLPHDTANRSLPCRLSEESQAFDDSAAERHSLVGNFSFTNQRSLRLQQRW